MGKKKKNTSNKSSGKAMFQANPFSPLKGFAASSAKTNETKSVTTQNEEAKLCGEDLFAREMAMLGVERTEKEPSAEGNSSGIEPKQDSAEPMTDEEQFLAALGEMPVRFEDQFPEKDEPNQASPRRMKLLKQGRLKPEATLDLHGMYRHQVVEKVHFFLQDAQFQGYRTLLVITGRGLHSDGEPVLRNEVERFLREDAKSMLAEWARAPRQYGGEGALIIFLKD